MFAALHLHAYGYIVQSIYVFSIVVFCSACIQETYGEQSLRYGIPLALQKRAPDYDGVIGFHAVVEHIFESSDIEFNVVGRPSSRLIDSLARGDVDATVGTKELILDFEKDIITSAIQVGYFPVLLYHSNRNNWKPEWPPDQNFKNKIGKSVYAHVLFKRHYELNVTRSPSVEVAVQMVRMGRVDYLIDNPASFYMLLSNNNYHLQDNYKVTVLFEKTLYLYFRNNQRGRWLKDIFDRDFLNLIRQERFTKIYTQRWKLPPPWPTAQTIVERIKQQYPSLHLASPKKTP